MFLHWNQFDFFFWNPFGSDKFLENWKTGCSKPTKVFSCRSVRKVPLWNFFGFMDSILHSVSFFLFLFVISSPKYVFIAFWIKKCPIVSFSKFLNKKSESLSISPFVSERLFFVRYLWLSSVRFVFFSAYIWNRNTSC